MSLHKSRVLSAKHILLRGFPTGTTAQDVRRLIARNEIKGVSEVAMFYKHFRPTGKAILTMVLPDYTTAALHAAESISVPGCEIVAEIVPDPQGLSLDGHEAARTHENIGNGPFAGVPDRKTVTISGFNGRASIAQIFPMLDGFRTARDRKHSVQAVPIPDRKFSLLSRFTVFLDSESEAQRFVRKYHMTRFKNIPDGHLLKASVIS